MKTTSSIIAFILLASLAWVSAGDYGWKASLSARDITPGVGVWMGGYAARKGPAAKIQQPLFAKALALKDEEGGRFVCLTLDLIGVPKALRTEIENYAFDTYQLPPASLVINASHTHCGPMIRLYRPPGSEDGTLRAPYNNIPDAEQALRVEEVTQYLEDVRIALKELIDECMGSLEPATLQFTRSKCGFAMNRRTPGPNKSWKNSPNPDGPVDHEVPVLQVFDAKKNLKGILFGYACHATTLSIMEINGDWPGYAQQFLEEDHPGVVAMFVNGASADQNPYPRRLQVYVERHGRSISTAVEAAMETTPVEIRGPLHAALAWPEIPYQTAPSKAALEKRVESTDRYESRHAAFLLEALNAGGSLPESYPVPVQVIRFGESMTWITMGGEVVVDYALRLKLEIGGKSGTPVWFAGYSNDVMTYIPSLRVLEEGGYEGGSAMRFVRSVIHPAPWERTIEETLVGKIHELYDELKMR
ncbi:MAG: neutral/alkaline non-lysosomal ceramidase N-terminal domain-containing protein [Verrucomicrobiales bacterium]|nr:neutral/alkaline non-lysosomal ceramidase N-terminal domain-containing protein [Verrucomicrobiales bacterium]